MHLCTRECKRDGRSEPAAGGCAATCPERVPRRLLRVERRGAVQDPPRLRAPRRHVLQALHHAHHAETLQAVPVSNLSTTILPAPLLRPVPRLPLPGEDAAQVHAGPARFQRLLHGLRRRPALGRRGTVRALAPVLSVGRAAPAAHDHGPGVPGREPTDGRGARARRARPLARAGGEAVLVRAAPTERRAHRAHELRRGR